MKSAALAPACIVAAVLTACGGGGGGTTPATVPAPAATGTSTVTIPVVLPTGASPLPAGGASVAGTVVQVPEDAYGPTTIGSTIYASGDAAQTTPVANAVVIIGPVPILGATPPATPPSGDVSVTTSASGTFAATPVHAPAPSTSAEPFVIPQTNILGFAPPVTGYYVEVFGNGSDGTSAGTLIPLHRFAAASPSLALRVSTIATAEAGALASINADRAAHGAGALIVDESAEEIARLHASDESTQHYTCHYDPHNIGPSSRLLAIGGIGLTGENLGLSYGPDAASAFRANETATLAEQSATPPGGHFLNLVDAGHQWAGVAAIEVASTPGYDNIDIELVTPNGTSTVVGASGYPTTGNCPVATTNNGS
jgi:uncharacterized protein YkwD